jgi:chromosome segregation ATPase
MEKLFTPEFWQAQSAVVISAPWVVAPLLLFAAFIGWQIKGWLDDREIRGLRTGWDAEIRELRAAKDGEISVLKERFNLAHDKQERLTEEIDQQRANSAKLEREVDELKTELAKVKARVPAAAFLHLDKQLDKVANTSAAMATTVNGLSDANSDLGSTLLRRFEITKESE